MGAGFTVSLSNARDTHNRVCCRVKEQPYAVFFVVTSYHSALGDNLNLKFGVQLLKLGLGFFDGLALKLGKRKRRFSGLVRGHGPRGEVSHRVLGTEGGCWGS